MRGFVEAVAVIVLIASGLALLLGIMELALGDSNEKVQATIVIAGALFGNLLAGVSWVLMDVANVLAPSSKIPA